MRDFEAQLLQQHAPQVGGPDMIAVLALDWTSRLLLLESLLDDIDVVGDPLLDFLVEHVRPDAVRALHSRVRVRLCEGIKALVQVLQLLLA